MSLIIIRSPRSYAGLGGRQPHQDVDGRLVAGGSDLLSGANQVVARDPRKRQAVSYLHQAATPPRSSGPFFIHHIYLDRLDGAAPPDLVWRRLKLEAQAQQRFERLVTPLR